jgi:hypothetical protein
MNTTNKSLFLSGSTVSRRPGTHTYFAVVSTFCVVKCHLVLRWLSTTSASLCVGVPMYHTHTHTHQLEYHIFLECISARLPSALVYLVLFEYIQSAIAPYSMPTLHDNIVLSWLHSTFCTYLFGVFFCLDFKCDAMI